jgi:hypothetical protein
LICVLQVFFFVRVILLLLIYNLPPYKINSPRDLFE